MLKSSVRTYEVFVMKMEEWTQVVKYNDGMPCAGKLACTVWMGGKAGDNIKCLPIHITSNADS